MATATEKRAAAVRYMEERCKMNEYTQGGKRTYFFGYPDNTVGNTSQKGFSDCSAAVRAAIKAATGIDIGSNTSAQINNRAKGLIVDQTDGYYPDESNLLPGDCLYFKGNESHPMDVGHVEMYTGPNECYGHGSGTGPTKKNLKEYCKGRAKSTRRYFMAIRWILDSDDDNSRRTLRKGMIGADVVEAQGMLIQLGYDLGSYGIDGDFGSATEKAVIAFKTNNALAPNGIVDADTWAKLDELMDTQGDDEDNPVLPVPEVDAKLIVENGTWNLRTGPGIEYPISGVVRGGEKLSEVETNGWKPVLIDGAVKWISPKALK